MVDIMDTVFLREESHIEKISMGIKVFFIILGLVCADLQFIKCHDYLQCTEFGRFYDGRTAASFTTDDYITSGTIDSKFCFWIFFCSVGGKCIKKIAFGIKKRLVSCDIGAEI